METNKNLGPFTNVGHFTNGRKKKQKNILNFCNATVIKGLLHEDKSSDLLINTLMLDASVDFILSSKRCDSPLM